MKAISYEVFAKELEKSKNIELYLSSVTNFEYYTYYIQHFIKFYIDNKLYLDKNKFLELIKKPFNFNKTIAYTQQFSYSREDKKIYIIFICILINKIKKKKHSHIELLRACYHESRHNLQLNFDANSYTYFLRYIDDILINNNNYTNYFNNHNDYSLEIGANLYSIFKTEEFLKSKYPDIYKQEKDYIENLENAYKLDYMLFDAVEKINKAFDIINEKKLKINNMIPLFNIFTNDDNSFKSIEDILKNPSFEKLDKRIVYTVLSSDLFLNSIDIEKLSDIELNTLEESLQYTYTIYNNQYQFIWKQFNNKAINFEFFIETAESLIKHIKKMDKHLLLLKSAKENKKPQFSKKY